MHVENELTHVLSSSYGCVASVKNIIILSVCLGKRSILIGQIVTIGSVLTVASAVAVVTAALQILTATPPSLQTLFLIHAANLMSTHISFVHHVISFLVKVCDHTISLLCIIVSLPY